MERCAADGTSTDVNKSQEQHPGMRAIKIPNSRRALEPYELAFPHAVSRAGGNLFSSETGATRRLYGLDVKTAADSAGRCLAGAPPGGARRPFRPGLQWRRRTPLGRPQDAATITTRCAQSDHRRRPARETSSRAACLSDTGRSGAASLAGRPTQKAGPRPRPQSVRLHRVDGRRRRQGRQVIGSTDEIGYCARSTNKVHLHDLHATYCTCWGSITRLTYRLFRPGLPSDRRER